MTRTVCGFGVLVVLCAGCGHGSGPVPVRGVVKVEGQPVANAAVVFVAQDPGGRDAYGSTDANGVFRLTTTNPDDGALPGKYKVVIQPAGQGGGERQFQVQIDPQRLYARGLGFKDVIDSLPANNGQVGGNVMDVGREQFLVRGLLAACR